jgi:hypothetical protein
MRLKLVFLASILLLASQTNLSGQSTVLGRILDSDGSPMPEITINLITQKGEKIKSIAKSNLQGLYVFVISPGKYAVELIRPGSKTPLLKTNTFNVNKGTNLLNFIAGNRTPQQFRLKKGVGIVWGYLTSAEKTRIDGALISFKDIKNSVRTFHGAFVFEAKQERGTLRVLLKTDVGYQFKYGTQLLPSIEIKNFEVSHGVKKYDIAFPRGRKVVIEALDINGNKPIEGMKLVLKPAKPPTVSGRKSYTLFHFYAVQHYRSKYTFNNVPPGEYFLRAVDSRKYYIADDSTNYIIKVRDSGDNIFKVYFVKPVSFVQGLIRGMSGYLFRKTVVFCIRSLDAISPRFFTPTRYKFYARPDRQGYFKVSSLPPGRYSIALYLPQSENIKDAINLKTLTGAPYYLYMYGGCEILGKKGANLTKFNWNLKNINFNKLGSICGRIKSRQGRMVPHARIFLLRGPAKNVVLGWTKYRVITTSTGSYISKTAPHPISVIADEGGKFAIKNLPAGKYEFLVTEVGRRGQPFWRGKIVKVHIKQGKQKNIEIVLPPAEREGFDVTVDIVDKQGNPARCLTPRFYGLIISKRGKEAYLASVNRHGQIKINLPSGRYNVILVDFFMTSFVGFSPSLNRSFSINVSKRKTTFTYKLPKIR